MHRENRKETAREDLDSGSGEVVPRSRHPVPHPRAPGNRLRARPPCRVVRPVLINGILTGTRPVRVVGPSCVKPSAGPLKTKVFSRSKTRY
jgi:hypothetical protein